MGEAQGFRAQFQKYRFGIVSGAVSAAAWGYGVMCPDSLPAVAFYVFIGSLIILALVVAEVIYVWWSDRPVGKHGYLPAGFEWIKKKIGRTMAEITGGPIFISKEDALEIIQESDWAQSKKAVGDDTPTMPFAMVLSSFYGKSPEKASRDKKFARWCDLALKKFIDLRPTAIAGDKINEQELIDWLEKKYDADVINEFGSI